MEKFEYLYTQTQKLIQSNKNGKFVIYPFGRWGKIVKQILNDMGVKEEYILDNNLCKSSPAVKSIDFLKGIDTTQYMFIITSENREIYDEIRCEIKKYVAEKNLFDLFPSKPFIVEYPRIKALEIASREIKERKIPGNVAEAGVYRGDFAYYINLFFENRRCYLFDTFDGFSERDIEYEYTKEYSRNQEARFKDTSSEMVLKKMKFAEQCVIKKGYFPETAQDVEDIFSFVSLDMDLYMPIKAGLEFFYPRLSRGGYIFVHDCNLGHVNFQGARQALLEFCEKEGIGYVMLPDNCTAVITK